MDSPLTEVFPHIEEVLLEFRAGKMLMDGNRVIPDTRKGLICIGRGGEGLVHFQWIDRSLNIVEDVSKEPKADNDTQLCSSVNFYLNQSLELPGEEEPDVSVPVQSAEEDISSRAGNLFGPSMVSEATSDVTSAGPVKLADLQRILSNIGSADEAGDPDAGAMDC